VHALHGAASGATISLAPGTYSGDVVVATSVSIVAAGPGVMLNGQNSLAHPGTVISVPAGSSVTLVRLTIQGGRTGDGWDDQLPGGTPSPGVTASGTASPTYPATSTPTPPLTPTGESLDDTTTTTPVPGTTATGAPVSTVTTTTGVTAPATASVTGGAGSGIMNAGHLHLVDCVVRDNATGDGGTPGGNGGDGAGIYNTGTLIVTGGTIRDNLAGSGGPGGRGGRGAGIYNAGTLTIERGADLAHNQAGAGCRGQDGAAGAAADDSATAGAAGAAADDSATAGAGGADGTNGGAAGPGGDGGGVFNAGTMTLQDGAFHDNRAGAGGQGGGLRTGTRGTAIVTNSTLMADTTSDGGAGGAGGAAGNGGLLS
jgi:hypothetical protein